MYVNVDPVIVRLHEGALQVLLHQRNKAPFDSYWALPGGQVFEFEGEQSSDASLDSAIDRIIVQKTGELPRYVQSIGFEGDRDRDPRGWSVSLIHLGILKGHDVSARDDTLAWFDAQDLESVALAFDHHRLIDIALTRFRNQAQYSTAPALLCGDYFTLAECQQAFEQVLGHSLYKASFRRRIKQAESIIATAYTRKVRSRQAQLYCLDQARVEFFDYALS